MMKSVFAAMALTSVALAAQLPRKSLDASGYFVIDVTRFHR